MTDDRPAPQGKPAERGTTPPRPAVDRRQPPFETATNERRERADIRPERR